MNKALSVLALSTMTCFGAMADEAKEDVNYGDPTASFTTLGVSASKDNTQINGMYGAGANIFQLDLTFKNKDGENTARDGKAGDLSGRARYFHVTDGLGYSVDVIGDQNNQTVLGGMIYKFQVSDNVMVFPMLSVGGTQAKRFDDDANKYTNKYDRSGLAQAGVYAMYAFDAGHWLYANPKSTYHFKSKEFINQIEVGGGFMLAPQLSAGFKVEYTGEVKTEHGKMKEDTVAWLQANYYF
ncbi:hypothetical protein G3R49_09330 [Shewanella sp. WXL01]|uniref:Porin n=1 Tax=Shewanella maritima TaxID=2520507 RepID=A0A411PN73_9GAMM|nr:hypothetical protein [Shewanella sp. WXL01]QBF84918.1 hypothetical protein EXU30_14440 [Shewanella maritima]